jgi:hypothetical protein
MQRNRAQLEIDIIGPEIGFAFLANPMDGLSVEQPLFRALPMPGFDSLKRTSLSVKDGALAGAAAVHTVGVLKNVFRNHPEFSQCLRMHVRIGPGVFEDVTSKLRELDCNIIFVRDSAKAKARDADLSSPGPTGDKASDKKYRAGTA